MDNSKIKRSECIILRLEDDSWWKILDESIITIYDNNHESKIAVAFFGICTLEKAGR